MKPLLKQPVAPFAEPALSVVLNYGPFSGIALRKMEAELKKMIGRK